MVRRPELTFWEKTYLPQIFSGLKITFRHFFRNLFLHIAHLFGRLLHLRAGATIQYPEELRPLMSRHRSRHRLTLREDETPRCVGCMQLLLQAGAKIALKTKDGQTASDIVRWHSACYLCAAVV